MAKNNAQRQEDYRARQVGVRERLNMMISSPAKRALEQLAKKENVTQRQALENALMAGLQNALSDGNDATVPHVERVAPNSDVCGDKNLIVSVNHTKEPLRRPIQLEVVRRKVRVVERPLPKLDNRSKPAIRNN